MTSVVAWRHWSRLSELSRNLGKYFTNVSSTPNQPETNDTRSNHNEEEHNDDEHSKTVKSKKSFSIDAEVIKGIQAQLASLTHKDELKKVGMTRQFPLEWDLVWYPPKFKPPMLHLYDGKSLSNQHIYYFRSQTGNIVGNDSIMARLFIGTLKGLAFDWFRSPLRTPSILGPTWKPYFSPDSTRMIPR